MSKEKSTGTKVCKHCKSEIAADAKICPNCRKKQGMSKILIVIIVLVVLGILSSLGGGDDEKEPETIEYMQTEIQSMYDEIDANPAAASEKYKDQYIEFSGSMDVIDSDLKYIGVMPTDGIHIISVHCTLTDDAQKDFVKSATRGDIVTVRGKCTEVGEIMGYTVDVMELSK